MHASNGAGESVGAVGDGEVGEGEFVAVAGGDGADTWEDGCELDRSTVHVLMREGEDLPKYSALTVAWEMASW